MHEIPDQWKRSSRDLVCQIRPQEDGREIRRLIIRRIQTRTVTVLANATMLKLEEGQKNESIGWKETGFPATKVESMRSVFKVPHHVRDNVDQSWT